MPKTSRRRRSSSVAPPADINSCSAEQLARLPAEVLRLHLASRHLVTSGSKATMAKRLYDALNPSVTDSNDASRSQVAPSPSTPPSTSTLSGNTPPSTNQLTTASAVHSPALQAQLSSLMAQFLQYATQPASISHEAAPGAARTTSNLSLASTVHASEQPPPSLAATLSLFSAVAVPPRPTTVTAMSGHPACVYSAYITATSHSPRRTATDTYGLYSSHSSRPNVFRRRTAGADTDAFAAIHAYQWLDYAATTLPADNAASSPPDDQRHLTTRASTDTPKDHTR